MGKCSQLIFQCTVFSRLWMSCTFFVGTTSGRTHLCPPVSQLLVLFFKARWQSFVLLVLQILQNSPKFSKFWYHHTNFPVDTKRVFCCVFSFEALLWVAVTSCLQFLTHPVSLQSPPCPGEARSSARAGGALGSAGGALGAPFCFWGHWAVEEPGPLVWWPGVLAAGICSWMASDRHWEHSRQRQSLINTLNHLCFDLSPDSQSDTESWKRTLSRLLWQSRAAPLWGKADPSERRVKGQH